MNAKSKGTRIERQLIEHLETNHNPTRCIRSAGSHGPFDIVAFSNFEVGLYQVKANHNPTREEFLAMQQFPVPYGVVKSFVRKDDRCDFEFLHFNNRDTWENWSAILKPPVRPRRPTKRGQNRPAR